MLSFPLLIKPTSSRCDLDCGGCFYKGHPNRGDMDRKTAWNLIRLYAKACEADPCYIWQGGEPTLYPMDNYRAVMEFQRACHRGPVANIIQTHGLNLNATWLDFFQEHNWQVGLSIDGEDGAGREWSERHHLQYQWLVAGLEKRSIPYSIVCTVDTGNVHTPSSTVEQLARYGRVIQFIPRRPAVIGEKGDLVPAPEDYAEFIHCARLTCERLGVCMVNDGQAHDAWHNQLTNCEVAPHCGDYLVIEADGGIYPCDFHVAPEWLLGNVNKVGNLAMLYQAHPRIVRFRELKTIGHPDCDECQARPACHRGCPYDRVSTRHFYGDKTPWCAALMDCADTTRPESPSHNYPRKEYRCPTR